MKNIDKGDCLYSSLSVDAKLQLFPLPAKLLPEKFAIKTLQLVIH